jgi:beta-lactamase class A
MASGLAAALAACRRKLTNPTSGTSIDTAKLDQGFPAIAARARPGLFAFGVMSLETTRAWYWNTGRAYPLAGAAAAPVAAAAMAEVEARKLSLDERIVFNALDLSPPPSAINASWPNPPDNHSASIPASTLFALALTGADATALDILTKRIGGPGAVGAFLEQKGVSGLRVDRYQRETLVQMSGMESFRPAWKEPAAFEAAREQLGATVRQRAMDAFITDPRDTATMPAALGFLAMLANGSLLSPASATRLMSWMGASAASRFRAGLPEGVKLVSIAGVAPRDLGFTAAVSELAIATFGSGRRYALAGFLIGSTATDAARDALFADAARLAAQAIG